MIQAGKLINLNRSYLCDPKEQAKFDLLYILFNKLSRLFA